MRISTSESIVLRGQQLCFKMHAIYHPNPTRVLLDLHNSDFLTGKVIDLSDSGMHQGAFVAVEVEGMEEFLIVPAERLS